MQTEELRITVRKVIEMLTDILNQIPPEEYDRIVEWPEDDTHLRDRCWKSPWIKVIYGWRDGGWKAWNPARRSWGVLDLDPGYHGVVNRVTPPDVINWIEPFRVDVWPEDPEDEKAIQKYVWEDRNRDRWSFLDGRWSIWSGARWIYSASPLSDFLPLTRTGDPETLKE